MICDYCKRIIYDFQEYVTTQDREGNNVYRHGHNYGQFSCWKYRKVRNAVTKRIKPYHFTHEVEIPEDLRCVVIDGGTTQGNYYLDELPCSLFPPDSFIRHDATHYGFMLTPDEVY